MAALHPDLDAVASLDAYTGELSTVLTVDVDKDTFGKPGYRFPLLSVSWVTACVPSTAWG